MEAVAIWYLTDNKNGENLADAISGLGLLVNRISGFNLKEANIVEDEINLFIFDLVNSEPSEIIQKISKEQRLQSFTKFVMLKKRQINDVADVSFNILHLEFLSRPINKREVLLLLEKTIIVERYREIMKFISKEADSRIEAYEGLININRKNIFQSEKEKLVFENILAYEKNLMREQLQLNRAIEGFTLLRQTEMFDMKNRIKAEEMLADLRRKELLDADNIIKAQESVIDYSAKRLDETQRILKASENVAELSRSEAIQMYEDVQREKELNKSLSEEIDLLLKEVDTLKKKLNEG